MTTATVPVPGPAVGALAGLRTWLSDAVGEEAAVRVGVPAGEQPSGLWVWPVALLPDQGTRGGGGRQPLRLRVRHLVTVGGPGEAALAMLDRILVAAAAEDRYHLVLEPVPEHLRVDAAMPAPALLIDVPVRIVVPAPPVPRVSAELRIDAAALCVIRGRVLGPQDIPLAGMTVSSPTTGTSVVTDPGGDFTLPGQPAGRAVQLRLSGRGLHLRVDVVPATTDPVVIHCDPQEV